MKQVGIALAGLGFMARMHSRAVSGIPGAKVVAAWSKFSEEHVKFKEFTEKLGFKIEDYYTDLGKMLKDPQVDAVICAVPYKFLEPIAAEVIMSGKPTILECPPAETPEGISRLEKLANESGARVMPGHCYRFAPCFRKAKELLEAGEIGKPNFVHFREFVPAESLARQWKPGSWIWDKSKGGPIPTMTVFCMDMARWILKSEPETFYADLKWREFNELGTLGYDVANVIKFRNGVTWVNEFSGSVAPSMDTLNVELVGERGNAVEIDGPEHVVLHGAKKDDKKDFVFEITRPERWGHRQQDEYFVKSVVVGGEKPPVTLQDARKALEMSNSIMKSSSSSNAIKFDWA